MDVKQIKYILTIAQEGGITRAANKLFITQSALDQQLIKLEKELGVQLFSRTRKNCALTPAGEIYVSYAKQMMQMKNEAYQKIYELADLQKGTLSVAFAPERGMETFMEIYPIFYQDFPGITVVPREIRVNRQIEMLCKGELDLCFLSMAAGEIPGVVRKCLTKEEFLLVTPLDHALASRAAPKGQPLTELKVSDLKDTALCLMYRESTQRPIIDPLFEDAEQKPTLFLETSSNRANIDMVQKGLACSIVPEYYVRNTKSLHRFRLEGRPSWELSACYRQRGYLSKAARYFIDLAARQIQRGQEQRNF